MSIPDFLQPEGTPPHPPSSLEGSDICSSISSEEFEKTQRAVSDFFSSSNIFDKCINFLKPPPFSKHFHSKEEIE
ncbi:MAG TPA: hypothetical protein P5048_00130 [Chlamydiales bacterium]|nr:hypothetical protein [Chlamydiales bacterium]